MPARITLATDPNLDTTRYGFMASSWPAAWVGPQTHDPRQSTVYLFRRAFALDKPARFRLHISVDQRYELSLDGQPLGRGPERGDLKSWPYDSYQLALKAGRHIITVRLYWLSPEAPTPEAQQTHAPAIIVYAEGNPSITDQLSTGRCAWQYQPLTAYRFADHDRLGAYFATGAQINIDGRQIDPAVEAGQDTEGWLEARRITGAALAAQCWESLPHWILRPASLPPAYEKQLRIGTARHVEAVEPADPANPVITAASNLAAEQPAWDRLLRKCQPLTIPPHTIRRVLIDLDEYYCAFPQLTCCGQDATVRLQTAEALFPKTNRDQIEGKTFRGVGFQITASDKVHTFSPHQFLAGRYIELFIQTGEAALTISSLTFLETHYPFRFTAAFSSSDPAHKPIIPIALRTLEMCSHDTSMDCPYYERLNYVGDTRLQSLVAYTWAGDDRLARKCIELFDLSRSPAAGNFTSSRYPTRTVQTIPTFSLWWACMVHDFAQWRNDPAFVRRCMGGVRSILDTWMSYHDPKTGLLRSPAGWNFVDWVPSWKSGIPAGGLVGQFSSSINLQALYTFRRLADLEDHLGELLLAKRLRAFSQSLASAIHKQFFNRKVGLFADDLAHSLYSEHAQCLAVLSGCVSAAVAKKLIARVFTLPDRAQCTIYFSHYLFETLAQVGRTDILLERLDLWKQLPAQGFRTTPEAPEPSRSDCHAWGAHPLYHFLANIAGIRPADFGFSAATIRPQLGALTHIEGTLPHPHGPISFDLKQTDGRLAGQITLPKNLPATLHANGKRQPLKAGRNRIA